MDPANNNPVQPAAPVSPAPASTSPAPAAPVAPAPAPVAPAAPVNPAPVAPVAQAPVNADVANAALNPPVNPVVAPGANPAASTMSMNQMFQTQPVANVFDETTAIAVPEGPKPPDPVEEELKAPLKAAEPVPGSIGSSVSMPPADGAQPMNNGVNEQMLANGTNPMAADANSPAGKKPNIFDKLTAKTKMSKSTLILLSVVAGLIVLVLVVILILLAAGIL